MTEDQEKFETLPVAADTNKTVSLASGIRPNDFEELNRFAALVHRARLSPKSFDSVEKIAIGILTNMELGRPIITGLQDLAIINGKCGIYGDASLAMVTASGLMDDDYPHEYETGTPLQDDWTFTFKVKRKGKSEKVGKWTWAESKRAGFDDPKQRDGKPDRFSPWRRFTRRMMQWKARNYVLRDVFGDVLKGMKTVEDLHDMDGVIDMTSSGRGSYEVEESTEDLAAKILNGKENGKHGTGLSDIDRDMGKAQDPARHEHIHPKDERWDPKKYICVCGFVTGDRFTFHKHIEKYTQDRPTNEINNPPPPEKKTAAFTTEKPADIWYHTDHWMNLRGPGFPKWLYKNQALLGEIPDSAVCMYLRKSMRVIDALRQKWYRCTEDTPFPGDDEKEDAVEKDPDDIGANGVNAKVVYDPNNDVETPPIADDGTQAVNGVNGLSGNPRYHREQNQRLKSDFQQVWDKVRIAEGFGMLAQTEEAAERWNTKISEELDKQDNQK